MLLRCMGHDMNIVRLLIFCALVIVMKIVNVLKKLIENRYVTCIVCEEMWCQLLEQSRNHFSAAQGAFKRKKVE